ncbi:ComEC/Rec2 family competence protein [Paenibacillus sp. P36]|uniref:ComEC/Rec2 family competence protein n=1 Tax=Paenibacillus sp. P36 TaxID=3342538 RepID=UPI0038B2DC11
MLNAKVQFLNVGWGDAHLIRLPSGGVCLIDGGDGTFSEEQDHPLSWMNRNDVDQMEWMLLTHIHEDHVNGLLDVARAKSVVQAVLPYEPFVLPPVELVEELRDDFTTRVYRMLATYLELIQVLIEQGTEIKWRSAYGSSEQSVIWSEEGITLTQLYPWEGDPLPAYEMLMQALSDEAEDNGFRENLPRFFDLSNHDSSVYRLSREGEPQSSVLFGGDQLEPGWERLAQRTDLTCSIWKVSHHGMDDGFNPRILGWIQPEYCIIPVSIGRSHALKGEWEELRSETDATFYLTGSYGRGKTCRIVNGSMPIEIGF